MYEMAKRNQAIILVFAGLLLFGIWYNGGSKKESDFSGTVDAVIQTEVAEPVQAVEQAIVDVESKNTPSANEPAASDIDISTLLPTVEPVFSACSASVTKNGNTAKDEEPIKTLPPDVPLIEDRNDDMASMPDAPVLSDDATTTEKTEQAPDEWVPFVYFYRQSITPWGPMRTLSVYPMISDETATQKSTSTPGCPAMIYPIFPVYPVFPVPHAASAQTPVFTPKVVPSRFGASKLVYPNGVVIKPKVYYPSQKARNVLRAVTP